MKWVTREKPKIDRIACPWLIKRFINADAEILYVPYEKVLSTADELGATPFDIPGVEFTHYNDECTFDYFVKKYDIADPAVRTIAKIVRGADTDRHDISEQSSGLWAISAGLADLAKDDQDLLSKGMMIYDALYNWARFHQHEKHTQQPVENRLYDVFEEYIKKKSKKVPGWVAELKELLQDRIDENISLKQLSENVNINPAYLSREFAKYFDNLSFGDYIRKARIDKAMEYLNNTSYSLTKIAYLTGFSDQSHFTRVFKKQTGGNPSTFRRNSTR